MQRLLRKAKKRGCHTVVALHHPVQPGVTRWDNGLKDRMEVVHVLEQEGPELVLHGHMHRPMEAVLFGSSRSIRVLGTGSASLDEPRTERRAQFRVLRFGTEGLEENTLYVHNDTRDVFEPLDP
jgi:diadenosine tetraphosphatase ApaH/serine/threonine PP2A family protein phosphatase